MRDNLTRKANKMSKDINFNAIMEALNDKMDRDGNNSSDTFIDEIVSRLPPPGTRLE